MTAPDEPVGEPAPTDRRLRVIAGTAEDGEKVLALLDDSTIRVDLSSGTVPWRQQILAQPTHLRGAQTAQLQRVGPPPGARSHPSTRRDHRTAPCPASS